MKNKRKVLTKALNRAMKDKSLPEYNTLRDYFEANKIKGWCRDALKTNVNEFGSKDNLPVIIATFTDTEHFLVFVPQVMTGTFIDHSKETPANSTQNKYWVCKYSWEVDLKALETLFTMEENLTKDREEGILEE